MSNTTARRRNAVIAAVAGAALLIGGSTYALWQSEADINGGSITSGTLNLTVDEAEPYDVSADRLDTAVPIENSDAAPLIPDDPASNLRVATDGGALTGHVITTPVEGWKMAPGDTVAIVMPLTITLAGDNLVAELTTNTSTFADDAKEFSDDMEYTFAIFDAEGAQIGETKALASTTDDQSIAFFQASGVLQQGGIAADTRNGEAIEVADGTAGTEFTLVVYAYFKYDAEGDKNVTDTLDGLPLTLTQVREGGSDQFVPDN